MQPSSESASDDINDLVKRTLCTDGMIPCRPDRRLANLLCQERQDEVLRIYYSLSLLQNQVWTLKTLGTDLMLQMGISCYTLALL